MKKGTKKWGAAALAVMIMVGSLPMGVRAVESCGPGNHVVDLNERYEANYTPCWGGFQKDHYGCLNCDDTNLDEDGDVVPFIAGSGVHTPGTESYPADYTECGGGFTTDYYACVDCGAFVDDSGKVVQRVEGSKPHTRSRKKWKANYAPCDGGYKEDSYVCEVCYCTVDENGNEIHLQWFPGTGQHIAGKKHKKDYTVCGGGYTTDYYDCIYADRCQTVVDADGNILDTWKDGNGEHTPGTKEYKPDYKECWGGCIEPYYVCTVCERRVGKTGDEEDVKWGEPIKNHTMEKRPEKAPTYEADGNIACYQCKDCKMCFEDEEGEKYIGSEKDILIPKLQKPQVDIKNGLEKVPEGVADQYTSVEEIESTLFEKALEANSNFKKDFVKSVLMDITLKVKNADGEWEIVTYENFPKEGVETLIPYPAGTNKDKFDFVVAHMITGGEKAGEIEILDHVLEENGIRVKFTSMSPVMVMYQEKDVKDTSVNAPTKDPSGTVAAVPKTGDASSAGVFGTVLFLSGSMIILLMGKKKRSSKV